MTATCVREPAIFTYTFPTEIVHIGTSNHTFWNIIPWILIVNKPYGAVDYSGNGDFKYFLQQLGYVIIKSQIVIQKNIKHIKMASYKNAQNSAPRDLKRTNCTINLPLVFTFLVYMHSRESLKFFFVTNLGCFIFTCQKWHVDLHMSRRVRTG